jgi:hypothetical protein
MNYFQARHAVHVFKEYRLGIKSMYSRLNGEADSSGSVDPAQRPSVRRASAFRREEAEVEDTAARSRLNEMVPSVQRLADELEVPTQMIERMPLSAGGGTFTRDILSAPLRPSEGLGLISRQAVLDTLDQCIGAAKAARHAAGWRLLNPLTWVIELVAFVIRIPFLVLRRAGVPAKVEESVMGHIIKLGFLIALAALGLAKPIAELVKSMK